MARGESGYVRAEVAVTIGGTYVGEGISTYAGGQTYLFSAKLRETDWQQPRQDTTDTGRRTGVGGPQSRKINLTMYYKGAAYPPDFSQYEVAVFAIAFGGGVTRTQVVLLESFKQTGDIDRALEYTVSGESDGDFS